jgi:hypothetical protein
MLRGQSRADRVGERMTPTFFALIVVVGGLLVSRAGAIYLQIVLCLFGAAAAISLPALGGAVITPATLFLPFLMARAWAESRRRGYLRRIPATGGWLALLVLWGVVGAIFIPRIFAHQTDILTVDRSGRVEGVSLFPLRPVSGNLTQSGYAIGAMCAFLSMRVLLERPGRLEKFRDAVLALTALDCLAAFINLAEYHLGLPSILAYVRTAYAVFDAYEIEGTGLMRIAGTFPETSGFCGFTLPLFAFTFSLWLNGVRPTYSGALAFITLLLLVFSTSTTAYVGLTAYACIAGFMLIWRGYVRGTIPRFGVLVAAVLLALALVGSAFVLETGIADEVTEYFQITVFNKLDSASGQERSSWNRQAWENFLDTYGVGVGLGSARASSYLLVLLSNVGILGTLLFFGFFTAVLRGPRNESTPNPIAEGSRQAVLASLVAAAIAGGVFDLGIAFYAYAAAATVGATQLQPDYWPSAGSYGWQAGHSRSA